MEKLILSLQSGNAEALDAIYAQTHSALFSVCLSVLKDKYLAEDALHDAYLILLKGGSYKAGGNAFSYLYTIAKNCALKLLGKKLPTAPDEMLATVPLSQPNSDDAIFLESLLATLDEKQREIVTLYAYAGLKHKEIASLLGLPEGTVRYIYAESIKKLKKSTGGVR